MTSVHCGLLAARRQAWHSLSAPRISVHALVFSKTVIYKHCKASFEFI
jgi:hypothetical protein